MLILAHTNGFGIDFYQFCQRVLKTPGDGHGGAEVHVIFRELRSRQGGGGVDGSACLVDNHIPDIGESGQHLCRHGLGFPGCGAVADGNVPHTMLADQGGKRINGLLLFLLTESGVDHRRVQHFAGGVHHCYLAAVAVSGVQSHGDKALYRGLHQQRAQIQGEIVDGSGVGPIGQVAADFPLNGGEDQPLVGILRGGPDKGGHLLSGFQRCPADQCGAFISRKGNYWFQDALLFTPVDGQNLVVHQPGNGLAEIIVQLVDALLVGILCCFADQTAPAHHQIPEGLADLGIVGQVLGDDVVGPLQGLFHSAHALFRVQESLSQNGGVLPVLGVNGLGQRFQALFPSHRAPGSTLLLIRAIQVFHFRHGRGGINGLSKFWGELALIFNGIFHFLPALLQIPQVGQSGFQIP